MRFLARRLRWMLIGAGAAWMLDPERGAQRRQMVAERVRALLARAGMVETPPETAPDPDVVTDAAWASAADGSQSFDERRLAAGGVR